MFSIWKILVKKWLSLHSNVETTAVDKIASYNQMVWLITLKFEIQIFRVMIFQAKHKISF